MLRRFFKKLFHRKPDPVPWRQSATLPYAVVDGRVAVLLITSRRTGKWVFPKGSVEPQMTPWDSAAREALEEAGVIGVVDPEPVGSYSATAGADAGATIKVDLYPLLVTEQRDEWKEKGQRLRHWATPPEARRLLVDRRLRRLVTALEARVASRPGTAGGR